MLLPDPPACAFASDNAAGAHPDIIEAIQRANHGHALAYGDDVHTRACEQSFNDLFGQPVTTLLALNGTGANVLAMGAALRTAEAVLCSEWSHINLDETGAPERILGTKLLTAPAPDGRLSPDAIDTAARDIGVMHHAQPGLVSITQATEWGTLYSTDDIAAICDRAHAHGMRVHLDGARLANAVAAAGKGPDGLRDMVVATGVDVLSFGGTKNGLLGAEAVVFINRDLAHRAIYLRKQVNQLASKMRFIAAQFSTYLADDRWLTWATHANDMASRLHHEAQQILGDHVGPAPQVNSVFPTLVPEIAMPLRDWCFFWDWDRSTDRYRWMTAWDTTSDDVSRFCEGLAALTA